MNDKDNILSRAHRDIQTIRIAYEKTLLAETKFDDELWNRIFDMEVKVCGLPGDERIREILKQYEID